MGGSVQRYIEEEFRNLEEKPVYLPGDTIRLRLRAAHEVNLGSVSAVFRRLPERRRAPGDPYITLPGKHYLLSRAGAVRASEVCFEIEVRRDCHLPGEYELEADVEERPSATLSERREYLGRACALSVSESTVSRMLRRLGWSRKKDRWERASATSS